MIQAPPPPPPLPEHEKALLPPPALPVLIDNVPIDQNVSSENSSFIDNDKKGESRSRDSQISESNSQEMNPFSSQSKYGNNQDSRPKKTTSRFSNPPTTKIPSLLDLPSENPYANNEISTNRPPDSFYRSDDIPTSNMKSGPNRFSQNQSNRFGNEQGPPTNNFSDGMNFSKDSAFGYRFGDSKPNWNSHEQPNSNRFADEPPFTNQFANAVATSGRDNFGNDNQDRFASGQNFANNPNRFGQDQLSTSSSNKFPNNSSQFSRFGQEQTRSSSNSQESFTFGSTADQPNSNPFPKDQDDRILPSTTFSNRIEVAKSFTNPFAQNPPNKLATDDVGNNFPVKDVKVDTDAGRNDNQRFLQNQTPNNFMITTPPTSEQRNLFPNQTMNRFPNSTNQDGFGRVAPRFDDFQNSFPRPPFNIPPTNQPMNQPPNFIPSQPNLQQPPPNFKSTNPPPNMVLPFNNTAFGMNFSTPPPINPTLLHTIPQPLPMSLNKIPPPKDLDLNAIPEPKMNMGNFTSGTG